MRCPASTSSLSGRLRSAFGRGPVAPADERAPGVIGTALATRRALAVPRRASDKEESGPPWSQAVPSRRRCRGAHLRRAMATTETLEEAADALGTAPPHVARSGRSTTSSDSPFSPCILRDAGANRRRATSRFPCVAGRTGLDWAFRAPLPTPDSPCERQCRGGVQ